MLDANAMDGDAARILYYNGDAITLCVTKNGMNKSSPQQHCILLNSSRPTRRLQWVPLVDLELLTRVVAKATSTAAQRFSNNSTH